MKLHCFYPDIGRLRYMLNKNPQFFFLLKNEYFLALKWENNKNTTFVQQFVYTQFFSVLCYLYTGIPRTYDQGFKILILARFKTLEMLEMAIYRIAFSTGLKRVFQLG